MKRLLIAVSIIALSVFEAPCDAKKTVQGVVEELAAAYLRQADQSAFRKAVAVLPPRVPESLGRAGAADAIAAYVREKLSFSSVFVLVERANMDAILSEIELGVSGLADPSKAAKAGEIIGAELLIQGSLSEAGEGLVLALDLVDVSSASVIASSTRSIPRTELLASGAEYLRSSFQSQYGISVYGTAGAAFSSREYYVPNYVTGDGEISLVNHLVGLYDTGVSYKPLPWLGLDVGYLGVAAGQFYLNADGRVVSSLSVTGTNPDGDRTVRYTMFSGSGLTIGATGTVSPTHRINISASLKGAVLFDPVLTHWFMDFANYGIDDSGSVGVVTSDIQIEGTKFSPSFGALGAARAEYLISKRMSVGLEGGYFWMPPFIPDEYKNGNLLHVSNTSDEYPTYMDKNGTFGFMGGFDVARLDGTIDSGLIAFDPSGLYAKLYFAVHF